MVEKGFLDRTHKALKKDFMVTSEYLKNESVFSS